MYMHVDTILGERFKGEALVYPTFSIKDVKINDVEAAFGINR